MNTSLTTILMTVLILFAPAVWNLTQHHLHFFLHHHHYNILRSTLFKDLNSVHKNLFKLSDNELTLILPEADLSTWENCLPWDFDYVSIQNTNALGSAVENFLTSTLLLFTSGFFKKLAEWLKTELVPSWIYVAMTKRKQ